MARSAKSDRIPTLPLLAWELLKLGAVAFGGLGSTLALLQRWFVDRHGWLQASDISEGLAFTRALPGSTGIQLVAYLGHGLRGWPGALIGAIAFIAPAMMLMMLAAAFSLALPERPIVNRSLIGLQVGVIGLLAASMWRLARSEAKDTARLIILVACAVLGFFVNAALVIAAAGLVGMLMAKEFARA